MKILLCPLSESSGFYKVADMFAGILEVKDMWKVIEI